MQAVVRAAAAGPTVPAAVLPELPTQTVTVGDTRILFSDLPARAEPAGLPLVFIHGLGGWLRNWAHNVHHCNRLGYRCLALDLPGFGRSDKPDAPYSPQYFREVLAGFMDAVGAPCATLIGNSMGGLIALATAQRTPERVDRLVLVDAAGVYPIRRTAARVTVDLVGNSVRRGFAPRRIMRSMRHWVFEQTPPELLAEMQLEFAGYADFDAKERARRRRSYLRALWGVTRANLRPWLAGITAPTLVVHGKQDKLVPFDAAGVLHREIPGARLAAFDACGHVPQLEMPARFNRALGEFLALQPAR